MSGLCWDLIKGGTDEEANQKGENTVLNWFRKNRKDPHWGMELVNFACERWNTKGPGLARADYEILRAGATGGVDEVALGENFNENFKEYKDPHSATQIDVLANILQY